MFITLPLMFIGVGFMIYLLFAAATYVLPLYAGLSAGFAALHSGATIPSAMIIGITAFVAVAAFGQMAIRLAPSRNARIAIALLFAAPAAIAGFQVSSALLHFGGVGGWGIVYALTAALITGVVAAKRYKFMPRA